MFINIDKRSNKLNKNTKQLDLKIKTIAPASFSTIQERCKMCLIRRAPWQFYESSLLIKRRHGSAIVPRLLFIDSSSITCCLLSGSSHDASSAVVSRYQTLSTDEETHPHPARLQYCRLGTWTTAAPGPEEWHFNTVHGMCTVPVKQTRAVFQAHSETVKNWIRNDINLRRPCDVIVIVMWL